eukprot:2838660-Pyramimonas_sp.AAC.1
MQVSHFRGFLHHAVKWEIVEWERTVRQQQPSPNSSETPLLQTTKVCKTKKGGQRARGHLRGDRRCSFPALAPPPPKNLLATKCIFKPRA